MNKIITNLSQIADAAEYFDKKTGAAWKIRSCLTNMGVWSANAYLAAVESQDAARQANAMITLATIRVWLGDCNNTSLVLDLTASSVRKTLGLERVTDVHAEACREARMKCIQTRSATNFKAYYEKSVQAFEARRLERERRVEEISNLLSDYNFALNSDVADNMQVFLNMDITEGIVRDEDLYDEQAVERQNDTLAECVGNCLEAMYDVCDAELASAITANKVSRLTGYHRAIMQMMEIAGVDTKRLAQRRVALEAQIDAMIQGVTATVTDIDAQIAEQMAHLPAVDTQPEAPAKPKRRTVERAGKAVTS